MRKSRTIKLLALWQVSVQLRSSKMDVYQELTQWDPSLIKGVVDHLNNNDIVTEADGLGLSSCWIEGWCANCTSLLRQSGYLGGELDIITSKHKSHGTVYGLYDVDHPNNAGNHMQQYNK